MSHCAHCGHPLHDPICPMCLVFGTPEPPPAVPLVSTVKWTPELIAKYKAIAAGPACPDCGRPVHLVPSADGDRRMNWDYSFEGEWTLLPHKCLPRAVRYAMRLLLN